MFLPEGSERLLDNRELSNKVPQRWPPEKTDLTKPPTEQAKQTDVYEQMTEQIEAFNEVLEQLAAADANGPLVDVNSLPSGVMVIAM